MTAFTACSKDDAVNELPYITFGVSGMDIDTRALIDANGFTSGKVYVYGVRNNTNSIYSKTPISKVDGSSNWSPAANLKRQWIAGSSYSFYAYTSSPDASNSIPTGGNHGVYVENDGLKITVSQPSTEATNQYQVNESNMVDYLLSHAYKVADGSNFHTVMLYMQHAMACVEINVERQVLGHSILLDTIKISNIFRSASMVCTEQAIARSGNNNVWQIQLSGANDVIYSKGGFSAPVAEEHNLGSLNILAVPQQLTNKASLTVKYKVDEDPDNDANEWTSYTQTFNLFNYVPYVWEPGNKIIYTLTINTGVNLKARIADWVDAGYTEGIIMPGNGNGGN